MSSYKLCKDFMRALEAGYSVPVLQHRLKKLLSEIDKLEARKDLEPIAVLLIKFVAKGDLQKAYTYAEQLLEKLTFLFELEEDTPGSRAQLKDVNEFRLKQLADLADLSKWQTKPSFVPKKYEVKIGCPVLLVRPRFPSELFVKLRPTKIDREFYVSSKVPVLFTNEAYEEVALALATQHGFYNLSSLSFLVGDRKGKVTFLVPKQYYRACLEQFLVDFRFWEKAEHRTFDLSIL